MKANNYISKKEHKLLLVVAVITVISAVASFASFHIEDYNKETKWQQIDLKNEANDGLMFAVDAGPDYRPAFRSWSTIFTFFIFIALLKSRKFFLSTLLTSFPFLIFIYWVIRTNRDIELNELYMRGTPHLLKIASYYDYLAFFFVSTLLFWQISILLRMLVKTLQKDEALP